ncbi:uncharacterized protein C8Q71DRAFT_722058 [Rhodofomes roseus]|uniref:Uncharacterized protein n=1 Tax=Rhodofomes roseus TaxID=34475 RepID=A0ABQ8KLN8_9APHY|nr:uncharacterized protein C8Q71DRAFT_722058 [Rhodofomes roseus]KAH9839018.1 hypothetical protein C8Q71DRAFT_722058 [Rhodofomes roseus]
MAPTRSKKQPQKRAAITPKKRTSRAKPPPPPTPVTLPPLPPLSIPPEDLPVVDVKVLPYPTTRYERGPTWIADERPTAQLHKGSRITLRTDAQSSGIGRLSAISDLRRHWVTFSIIGAQQQCNLRVPIPWVILDGLESFTHQEHYLSLPNDPPPHRSFIDIPAFRNNEDNPYEFDVNDEDIPAFSKRLANIANKYWRNLELEGRRASLDH